MAAISIPTEAAIGGDTGGRSLGDGLAMADQLRQYALQGEPMPKVAKPKTASSIDLSYETSQVEWALSG
jgi:hypothetical protein